MAMKNIINQRGVAKTLEQLKQELRLLMSAR